MKARLFIFSIVLVGMFSFNSRSARVNPELGDHSASLSIEPQERAAANAFDLSEDQPPSIYVASRDRTRVRVPRDPKLNQDLLDVLNGDQITRVREQPIGSNDGPEVRVYLDYCGISGGAWWCAAFVSYQVHRASIASHVASSWPKYANCVDIYNWGLKHQLLLAEPGAPSVMLIPGNPRRHQRKYVHTGFVVEYDPSTNTIVTVEGNSNNDGSSNGIGVFRLRRRVTPGMRFVKIV